MRSANVNDFVAAAIKPLTFFGRVRLAELNNLAKFMYRRCGLYEMEIPRSTARGSIFATFSSAERRVKRFGETCQGPSQYSSYRPCTLMTSGVQYKCGARTKNQK